MIYTLEPQTIGSLVSQLRSGVTSFYLSNGFGTASQLASSTGTVTDNYVYDSFGDVLAAGTTSNAFTYVGLLGLYRLPDLSGYQARARLYTPALGRFLSVDPLFLPDTQTNVYTYASNNPLLFVDATGLQASPTAPECRWPVVLQNPAIPFVGPLYCFPSGCLMVGYFGCCALAFPDPRLSPQARKKRKFKCCYRGACPSQLTLTATFGLLNPARQLTYGCYCGPGNVTGPGSSAGYSSQGPTPFDAVDACCAAHDDEEEFGTQNPGFDSLRNQRFCACLRKAKCSNQVCIKGITR